MTTFTDYPRLQTQKIGSFFSQVNNEITEGLDFLSEEYPRIYSIIKNTLLLSAFCSTVFIGSSIIFSTTPITLSSISSLCLAGISTAFILTIRKIAVASIASTITLVLSGTVWVGKNKHILLTIPALIISTLASISIFLMFVYKHSKVEDFSHSASIYRIFNITDVDDSPRITQTLRIIKIIETVCSPFSFATKAFDISSIIYGIYYPIDIIRNFIKLKNSSGSHLHIIFSTDNNADPYTIFNQILISVDFLNTKASSKKDTNFLMTAIKNHEKAFKSNDPKITTFKEAFENSDSDIFSFIAKAAILEALINTNKTHTPRFLVNTSIQEVPKLFIDLQSKFMFKTADVRKLIIKYAFVSIDELSKNEEITNLKEEDRKSLLNFIKDINNLASHLFQGNTYFSTAIMGCKF